MSTNTFKSTLDTNSPWKRYYEVYGKNFQICNNNTGPDSCRDDREYFAVDQHNNTYENFKFI